MSNIVDVSVVTTVLNEGRSLPTFLESLARQRALPQEFVVVDGGSIDDTVTVLRAWEPPHGVRYTVIESPGANISQGRNHAIRSSNSAAIAVADAGTTLDADWLVNLHRSISAGADVASGFFRPAGTTFINKLIARVILPTVDEIDPETFLPSSRSIAFSRSAWERVGGYPEWLDYCEDVVFDLRLKSSGAHFTFVPDAFVSWDGRSSLPAFAKQYWRYARGDAQADLFWKRHLARYLAYTVAVCGIASPRLRPWIIAPGTAAFALYCRKFVRRVAADSDKFGPALPAAIALTPVVVVTGDIAKMGGYFAGWIRRARRSQGKP